MWSRLVDRGGRSLGHQASPTVLGAVGRRWAAVGRRSSVGWRWHGWVGVGRFGAVAWPVETVLGVTGAFRVEGLQDPRAESLLELEQDADAGEVHAALAGEVADPEDPPDVVLAVEPDVGRRPGRAEQALVLVDPQRARMRADELAATLMT